MTTNEKITNMSALKSLAQRINTNLGTLATKEDLAAMEEKIPIAVSQLENDSSFQTAEQVEEAINAKIVTATVYRAGGSTDFGNLPSLTKEETGLVVNVTDAFTTTSSFVEGAGKTYPAGTNVAVVQAGKSYKYDVLAGFVDLSHLVEKEDGMGLSANDYTNDDKAKLDSLEIATDEEVTDMLNEVFGDA